MKEYIFEIQEEFTPFILSAVVGLDSFFYGVFDKEYNLCVCYAFDDITFDDYFVGVLSNRLFEYQNIPQKVTFTTKPFLHVDRKDKELTDLFPAFDDKILQSEEFTSDRIMVMYGLGKDHIDFLNTCLPKAYYHHISTVMHTTSAHENQLKIYLHADKNVANIVVSANDKLLYFNQFACVSDADYLYFTLMTYDLFKLDPHHTILKMSGRIKPSDTLYDLLRNYIKHVEFTNSSRYEVKGGLYSEMKHIYQDLYSTAVCES